MRDAARRVFAAYEHRMADPGERVPSAVLLLLQQEHGEEHLLFQVRSHHVEFHKGEISLPGGARDPGDPSLLHTALRETHEEIGVHPDHVDVLGRSDEVVTRTNFLISPFVGAIREPGPYAFRYAEAEVAELLRVPVPYLLSRESLEWTTTPFGARMQAYRFGDHLILGVTALIVRRFLEVLSGEPPPSIPDPDPPGEGVVVIR